MSRIFADDALAPAVDRARALLRLEHLAQLDVEAVVNGWFVGNDTIGLLASYHYATAHYVVTAGVLLWLFRRDRPLYARARTALALATVLALAAYLLLPTAPPRLMAGWTDVLALHADRGWWGEAASAPQGMGWMTNQLAAFPSMHAGWALWVALAVSAATASRTARTLAWAHAGLTTLVVIGTGNHWVLDVVVGWFVVTVVWFGQGGSPTGQSGRRWSSANARRTSSTDPSVPRWLSARRAVTCSREDASTFAAPRTSGDAAAPPAATRVNA